MHLHIEEIKEAAISSPFLEAALALAAEGFPVFPCVENGKEPACPHGFKEATTDEKQIREWWQRNPNYNIAISPADAGLIIVDIDAQKGGEEAWAAYCARENFTEPETYKVRTPHGGRHLYLLGTVPSSRDKLGKGIDTRSMGGYALVPPSVVEGKPYAHLNAASFAPAPDAILSGLAPRHLHATATVTELDTPTNLDRARAYLTSRVLRGDVARAGHGGNGTTYEVAAVLHDLGISSEKSLGLLLELFNPACQPPWDYEELAAIVDHVEKYAQNEAGAFAVEPAEKVFANAITPQMVEASKRTNRFFTVEQMATLPDPQWLVKDLLMEQSSSLLVGPWRSYKSFIGLDLAMSIATGKMSAFGRVPERVGPTIYSCREGMVGIAKVRRRSWCIGHDLEPDHAMPFYLGLSPLVAQQADCDNFMEDALSICGGETPALVVIDTLARSMAGLDETKDAGSFLLLVENLTKILKTNVLVLHHFGHDKSKNARGGTIYPASFDTYAEVETKGARRVEIWVRKQKDAEEPSRPFTMQGRLVPPSLCFFSTDPREHAKEVGLADPFNRTTVGQALSELGAYGPENARATAVLAQQMFLRMEDEDVEDYEQRIENAVRKLHKLSRHTLNAYAVPSSVGPRWCLPSF